MHVAELLASHGASLNVKTFLEETPIGILTPQHSYQYTCWKIYCLISTLFSQCNMNSNDYFPLDADLDLFCYLLSYYCSKIFGSSDKEYIFKGPNKYILTHSF